MSGSIQCTKCRVWIAKAKLDLPNRCTDWQCPTMSYEFRMNRAIMLGMTADKLAKMERCQTDALAADKARASEAST